MKKFFAMVWLVLLVIATGSFMSDTRNNRPSTMLNDSLEKDRARYVALIQDAIRGKEKMKVDSVFSNLKVLGGFPAGNLVMAMDAWSRGLGVSCGHCHNTGDFASDEKQKKEVAREMVKLGSIINSQLKTIKGLSEKPVINCITCHRGELKPALRMPAD